MLTFNFKSPWQQASLKHFETKWSYSLKKKKKKAHVRTSSKYLMKRINHYWYTSPILYQTNYVLYQFLKKWSSFISWWEWIIWYIIIYCYKMITDYTECCIQYFCTSLYSLRQIYHHQPQWSTYYYDIFLIHMICFKIKKIKEEN